MIVAHSTGSRILLGFRLPFSLTIAILVLLIDNSFDFGKRVRQTGFNFFVTPMVKLINAPFELYNKSSYLLIEKQELQQRIEQLEKQKRDTLFLKYDLERQTDENIKLNRLLHSIKESQLQFGYLVTNLVAIGLSGVREEILINHGDGTNVYEGQIIVDENGLIGIVTEVYADQSRVYLIQHPKGAVPVEFSRTGLLAVTRGNGSNQPLSLDYISVDSDVRVDDLLFTSGIGGRYPKGIPVARVISATNNHDKAILEVKVKPLSKLHHQVPLLLLFEKNGQ